MRLEIAGRGQQAQRPARRVAFLLRVGLPVRHRRQPGGGQLLGIEFEPARRRAEFLALRRGVAHRPARAQRVEIGAGDTAPGAVEQLGQQLRLRHAEHRIGQPHAARQFLRQPQIRPRLALRRHRGAPVLHPIGAVGAVEILGFEIGRRGQHDIGVARRHRQKRVVHDREQILAQQAPAHLAGVGTGHGRVVRRDEQPAQRRVGHVEQRVAEPRMVDEPGLGRSGRPAQRAVIQLARRRGQQQRAAAAPSIGAGHAGQQCHRAQRLAAARQPRHALAEPDKRPLRGRRRVCAKPSISSSARPVISATRAGGKRGSTSASSRSKPIVCAAM